jgi:hypothetical protein
MWEVHEKSQDDLLKELTILITLLCAFRTSPLFHQYRNSYGMRESEHIPVEDACDTCGLSQQLIIGSQSVSTLCSTLPLAVYARVASIVNYSGRKLIGYLL